ncbi:histidine kinase N-terminal 7TM domain-containing protein, partial [Planomonospora corallina]
MGEPLLALVFILSALMSFAVTVVSRRRRHVAPAVGALAVVAAAIGTWSAVDGLSLLDPRIEPLLPVLVVKFLAVCAMPAGVYGLSLAVVDRTWRLTRRLVLVLAVEPALVVLALLTNSRHHWFLTSMRTVELQGGADGHAGPLFWVHTGYSYVVLAVALAHLLQAWLRGPRAQRGLYGSILLATLPPLTLNVVSTFGIADVEYLTPVGFCLTTVIIHWSLVRRSLHELVPVERTHVFDMLSDMVMTIDDTGRILDANPSAERLLRQLAPDLPASLSGVAGTGIFGHVPLSDGMELDHTVTDPEGRRIDLNVRVTALHDNRGHTVGWAFVGRDVTALNDQHRALQHANRQLRDQVATIEALRADLAEQAVRDALTGLHNRRHL